MRARYTVLVERFVAGEEDAHGNVEDGYYAPEPLQVFYIAPKGSQEPGKDRAEVTTGLTLGVPPGAVLGPHDRVVVDGVRYEVEGSVADYTRGPFGSRGGLTVALTREEG